MRNVIKLISIAIILFVCVGCASQSQGYKKGPNVSSMTKSDSENKIVANTKPITAAKNDLEIEEKPLNGLTVCIDAGHGITTRSDNKKEPIAPGSDIMKAAVSSGTIGVSTRVTEESINLTVSKKLRNALTDKGANIIMIRETSKCDLTNVERTNLWNSSGADLTIRIHCNGINNSKVSGILMMIPGEKYIKNKEMLRKSEQAGKYILNGVLKYTKAKSRGTVRSNDLTGFNWSKIPVVLLEMGFMTNPQEDKLLNTDEYQNKMVVGIIEGLEEYYRNSKLDETK